MDSNPVTLHSGSSTFDLQPATVQLQLCNLQRSWARNAGRAVVYQAGRTSLEAYYDSAGRPAFHARRYREAKPMQPIVAQECSNVRTGCPCLERRDQDAV